MATINTTLAAGSVTSPYYLDVRISKQLCNKTATAPVFNPVFSLVSYNLVGTITSSTGAISAYEYEAVVSVQGIVTYTPCGSCCAKSQTINQTFVIPFLSTTAVTGVTVASGTATNTLVTTGCSNCSNQMLSDVPITLTVA